MGIFQRAVETFDALEAAEVGVYREGQPPMAPVSHITTSANIEIRLDIEGVFQSASVVDKKETKIIIPATEPSAGRTRAPTAHPLCDNLGYLSWQNPEKHGLYLQLLGDWAKSAHSHPTAQAVFRYIQQERILSDLEKAKILELGEDGLLKNKADEKLFVRWVILDPEKTAPDKCWQDETLFASFKAYYKSQQETEEKALCMVSGLPSVPAKQHPKGVVPFNGNAKLISANDKSGFTYRGRFREDWEAATVSYEVSQKAHNALKWLIEVHGVYMGGRAFLCWNPQGKTIQNPFSSFLPGNAELFQFDNYRQQLLNTILSIRKENQLTGDENVVIAALDAATPGRLSVTYYREMPSSDFLERLRRWDELCCWENGRFGIQSPGLKRLVDNAFGTQREAKGKTFMETDERILRQHLQRLLDCKLRGDQRLPMDIVRALTQRASTPQAYDPNIRLSILFTACAALRKYRYDYYKEEWPMSLDTNNTSRSYLFGRLLAIAEMVEKATYDDDETRLTNALKMQSVFSKRPLYAWGILEEKLNPYYARLRPGQRSFYKKLIGEITDKLELDEATQNQPLDAIYLFGYYHQRQDFYKKKSDTTENQTTEE